jgi:hypothetical protein
MSINLNINGSTLPDGRSSFVQKQFFMEINHICIELWQKNQVPTRSRTYMKREYKFVVFSLKTAIFTASAAGLNLRQFQTKIIWCIIGPISIDQTPSRFKKHTLKFDHSTLLDIPIERFISRKPVWPVRPVPETAQFSISEAWIVKWSDDLPVNGEVMTCIDMSGCC